MRILIALGGNALLRRGQPLEADLQRENVLVAARSIAAVARRHEVVVTHGNGPQVGLLALQSEAYTAVHPYPLDVLGAESEGMIGYLLQQALENELPERDVVTVLTEVMVDSEDEAFAHPTKPVGPQYPEAIARALAAERGWTIAPDGNAYRRVVPSPEPREIVQADTIRGLVNSGTLVICSGGGGIPVVLEARTGRRLGVEAVIDKDRSAALLAVEVHADLLMLLTDVDAVERGWGTTTHRPICVTTPDELAKIAFEPGSMGPKVDAACRFVRWTGKAAVIGSLSRAEAALDGISGTRVEPAAVRAAS